MCASYCYIRLVGVYFSVFHVYHVKCSFDTANEIALHLMFFIS